MSSFSYKSTLQIDLFFIARRKKKKKDFQIGLKTKIIFLGEKNGIVSVLNTKAS